MMSIGFALKRMVYLETIALVASNYVIHFGVVYHSIFFFFFSRQGLIM